MIDTEVKERQGVDRKLPDGWKWVKLGDVCTIIMGQSPVGTSYNLIGKGEPLLNGPTEFGSVYPTPVQWTSEPTRFAQPYDILFCVRGATTGRKNIADRNYCIGRGLAAIRGKEGETDTKFLMFLLDTVTDSLLKETAGSTFPNLPGEKLERFEIPLPPLAEQKRIAAILNEQMEAVEKARKATEAQLEAAKELPAAYLRAVFNSPEAQKWESKTLEDVCRDISDGTHFTPEYIDSGIPFLSVKNIREYGIFFEDCRFISVKQHQDFCKRCKPEKGDVLYTKVGTTGIAKAIDIEQEFSIFVSVALLKLGSLVVPEYLETVLNSPICRKQAETLTQGAANRNLVLKDLKRINFPLPSILKQQQIVAEVSSKMENVKTLENSLKSQLEAINQIPSAILRKAFNGQL